MNLKHTRDTIMTLVAPAAARVAQRMPPRAESTSFETLTPPRARFASLETLTPPRARFASLEGSTLPSGEVASLEGSTPPRRGPSRSRAQRPLGEDRLARGHLHEHHPRSCPVWAFNALTPQDARHDPDTPGNRVLALFHQLPGEGHPRHCVALCDEVGVSPVTLCRLPLYG
jgi:hypothetical protein